MASPDMDIAERPGRAALAALGGALAGAALLAAPCPAGGAAPPAAGDPGIDLEEAVGLTLAGHPALGAQRQRAARARAGERAAAAGFDTDLVASAGHRHEDYAVVRAERLGYGGRDRLRLEETTWRVGASRRFPVGTVVEPSVELTRRHTADAFDPEGRARVAVRVTQPLLRGRGRDAAAADLAAAGLDAEAEALALRHEAAVRVLATASAFWQYRAAVEAVAIQRDAEARAGTLVGEMRALIEGDERPAADLGQLLALEADRAAARIQAEGVAFRALQAVALAMGLAGDALRAPVVAAASLPAVDEAWAPGEAAVEALVAGAAGARADVQAARTAVRAAEVLLARAERDRDPALDLGLSAGWSGLREGDGAAPLVTPLWEQVGGPDAGLDLTFRWPLGNRAAEAEAAAQAARVAEARLAAEDLERTVASDVRAAADEVARGAATVVVARRALALQEAAVDDERRRLRAGLATALDVRLAEERRTAAALSALDADLRHALALAGLRFATGTLAEGPGDPPAAVAARLRAPPALARPTEVP